MGRVEGAGDVAAEGEHLVDGQRAAGETRRQRLPFQQLHDHEVAAVVLADVEERADVGVTERRDDARLALKALGGGAIAVEFGRQQLHGDTPAQAHVLGRIDLAHGAAAQGRQDAVVRQRLADHAEVDDSAPSQEFVSGDGCAGAGDWVQVRMPFPTDAPAVC